MLPGGLRKSKFPCASREAARGWAERGADPNSGSALRCRVTIVAKALEAHRNDIERGALLSIDEAGTRVRMLPLRRSGGFL
jgi:hypothetical protein